MKTILIFLFVFTGVLKAPEYRCGYIAGTEPVRPYEKVFKAMAQVESTNNPFAYNANEGSCGLWQIRRIRLDDYYRLTGIRYYPADMFDVSKSEEVINYYAFRFGAYRIDEFIKKWNGSGRETVKYLEKVQEYLNMMK